MDKYADMLNEQKKTNKLLALLVSRDLSSKSKQIALLSGAGFKPAEIAPLIGTTANAVSVAILKAKKKDKK